MKRIEPVVLKETAYIAVWILLLSLLTQSVFLIIGKWDYTVLLGNILSGCIGVINFLLLGITVQKAVGKEKKEAATTMKVSQSIRTLLLFAAAAVGALLPQVFNIWSVLIPLFFPRIAIAFRPMFNKSK